MTTARDRDTDPPRLLATKFQPPTYGDNLVQRPHLIQRLNAGRSRRLVLVQAPAGYGKTTLAVQWCDALRAAGLPVAWVSLDEDDNDLVRFLSYLVEALRGADSSLSLDLFSVLETQPEDAAKFVLGELINGIAVLGYDIFLIFDDWHHIHAAGIQESMQFLLAHAPTNLHILMASRTEPGCNLTRLRVEDEIVQINAADLRFNSDESRAFLADINQLDLQEHTMDRLWRATDGWVAALQLASLSTKSGQDPGQAIENLSAQPHSLGDYLAENVLNNLPDETLEFLIKSSILERLSGSLCAAVTGFADSQRRLEELERKDLFIRPLQENREWFRYHHLFALYLQRRLTRDRPGQVQALHQQACEWFAANGYTGEAVTHALAADDRERAVDLIQRDAMWLVEHSRMATLLGLVRRLSAANLEKRPWLQIAVAWSHCLMHHLDSAQRTLDAVKFSLEESADYGAAERDELLTEARVLQGTINIYGDRIGKTAALLEPCVSQTKAQRPWVIAVAANVLTYVAIHSFDFDHARRLQAWAESFHRRTQGPFSGIYGRCFSGMASARQGELREAAAVFQAALAQANDTAGAHSHAARLAAALWGQVNYEYHELDRAEQLLEESRVLGAEGGVADFSLATYIPLARIKALRGDVAHAHALLDEGMETAEALGLGRLAAAVDGERVRLYLATGEIPLAEHLLVDDLREPDDATGIEIMTVEARQLATARVFFAQGHMEQAAKLLDRLIGRACEQGRGFSEVGLRVLMALVQDNMSAPELAERHLLEALELGAPQGMVRTFLDEGSRVAVPLERLRDRIRHGKLERQPAAGIGHHINHLIVLARDEGGIEARPQRTPAPNATNAGVYIEPLNQRERQIVSLLGNGCSNKEIARTLGVGVNTVKWYLKGIYTKLCVNRRTQAVAEAKRLGILE